MNTRLISPHRDRNTRWVPAGNSQGAFVFGVILFLGMTVSHSLGQALPPGGFSGQGSFNPTPAVPYSAPGQSSSRTDSGSESIDQAVGMDRFPDEGAGVGSFYQPLPPGAGGNSASSVRMASNQVFSPPQPLQSARILARVGSEVILAADIEMMVNEQILAIQKQYPAEQLAMVSEEEWEKVREMASQRALETLIDNKMIYLDAKNTIPEEGFPQVQKKIRENFEALELQKWMEREKASTRKELDDKLRQKGTTLAREIDFYVENQIAIQWIQQQIRSEKEITHTDILGYYESHKDDYFIAAKCEWEEIAVKFTNYQSKAGAYHALARMGNQVLRGVPFAEVAQASSEGPTSDKGGKYNWTAKGELRSKVLEEAIFNLPVGTLSAIVEDETGFHIIRVIRREDSRYISFQECQVEIQKKLRVEDQKGKMNNYLDELRRKTTIWNVFDDQKTANKSREKTSSVR